MPISTTEIIETLKSKGINPTEDEFPLDDLPEIGVVSEQEDIYTTSVDEIFELCILPLSISRYLT